MKLSSQAFSLSSNTDRSIYEMFFAFHKDKLPIKILFPLLPSVVFSLFIPWSNKESPFISLIRYNSEALNGAISSWKVRVLRCFAIARYFYGYRGWFNQRKSKNWPLLAFITCCQLLVRKSYKKVKRNSLLVELSKFGFLFSVTGKISIS